MNYSYNIYSVNNILLMFFIGGLLYISLIIYYLYQLKNCICSFKNKNTINLDYLIGIELFVLLLYILSIVYLYYSNDNKIRKIQEKYNYYIIIYNIFLILLYIYYSNNVSKLYQNIDENCICTQSWIKFLLRIQSFFLIIHVIINFYIYSYI